MHSVATEATRPLALEDCRLISGGMGVNVLSSEGLGLLAAQGVAATASVTAADIVLGRELMRGNQAFLRAVEAFPNQTIGERILGLYWHEGGVSMNDGRKVLYPAVPMTHLARESSVLPNDKNQKAIDTKVVGGFALTWLAKQAAEAAAERLEGETANPVRVAPIGINGLYKILDGVGAYYGAMLAGSNYLAMGAGMPLQFPKLVRELAEGKRVEYLAKITGGRSASDYRMPFDPRRYLTGQASDPKPMDFLLIATTAEQVEGFMRTQEERDLPYGYIMENHFAGGHNAPPMGGEAPAPGKPYVYSERDELNTAAMKKLGVRYWVAGDQASPQKLREALEHGARGVQLGSVLALADESNVLPQYRQAIVGAIVRHKPHDVFASPTTSPSGFPFNVVKLPGTVAFTEVTESRRKICDIGKLVEITEVNGQFATRCPAGPESAWEKAGGKPFRLRDQNCLCNSLFATIGLGQLRRGEGSKIWSEPAEITLGSGETVNEAVRALVAAADQTGRKLPGFSVSDVVAYMEQN